MFDVMCSFSDSSGSPYWFLKGTNSPVMVTIASRGGTGVGEGCSAEDCMSAPQPDSITAKANSGHARITRAMVSLDG